MASRKSAVRKVVKVRRCWRYFVQIEPSRDVPRIGKIIPDGRLVWLEYPNPMPRFFDNDAAIGEMTILGMVMAGVFIFAPLLPWILRLECEGEKVVLP